MAHTGRVNVIFFVALEMSRHLPRGRKFAEAERQWLVRIGMGGFSFRNFCRKLSSSEIV